MLSFKQYRLLQEGKYKLIHNDPSAEPDEAPYGYWILPDGSYIPVPVHAHQQKAKEYIQYLIKKEIKKNKKTLKRKAFDMMFRKKYGVYPRAVLDRDWLPCYDMMERKFEWVRATKTAALGDDSRYYSYYSYDPKANDAQMNTLNALSSRHGLGKPIRPKDLRF